MGAQRGKYEDLTELQRTHWMVHSQTKCFIDVISSRNALATIIRWFKFEDHPTEITLSSHITAYPSCSEAGEMKK